MKLNQGSKGFTLIEMAIVMVIGGILLSFMGSALLTYMKKGRVDKTEYRMEAIKEALNQYLNINRRYPCPARQDIAPGETPTNVGDPRFGIEIDTDCSTPFADGNEIVGAGDIVRIGSVPTRTLNLPDEFSLDGWGNRFTYAVTIQSASTTGGAGGSTFTNSGGLIEIADSSGNVFLPASAGDPGAHYILVSHGITGEGAYTLNGNLMQNCNSGAMDNENCDHDDIRFINTLVNSGADTADFYDDYMYYQGQTLPDFEVFPSGAVLAFNSNSCPTEWSPFVLAQGRFIIGTNGGTIDYPALMADQASGDLPVNADGADITTNIDFGHSEDETDSNGLPPFVALTYCEKD